MKIAIGGVVLILAISCIAFLIKGMNGAKPEETESESAVELTTGPEKTSYVISNSENDQMTHSGISWRV